MTSKCRKCKGRIDARTLKAGGELCWECATTENVDRAFRAKQTLLAYKHDVRGEPGSPPDDSDAIDLVADILHWAAKQGHDPQAVLRMSAMHYEAETEGG